MDLHEIKRKHFRVSVAENDAVSIKINNIPFEVMDLNDGGIGIWLSPEDILVAVGDEFPLQLKIDSLVLALQGKVMHISSSGPKEVFCGIKFMDIDEKSKAKLMEFLSSCREKDLGI